MSTRSASVQLSNSARAVLRGSHHCSSRCPVSLRLLERLLARLTRKQYELVCSALLEGGTRRQIAARFGIRHQTVSQQLAAADLATIRLALQLTQGSIVR